MRWDWDLVILALLEEEAGLEAAWDCWDCWRHSPLEEVEAALRLRLI